MSEALLGLRSTSQLLSVYVVPEARARIASGRIAAPPLHIHRFRLVQTADVSRVELNEEVQIVVTTRAKRAIRAGEDITLDDIDPNDCRLEPPQVDGRPAAYFLCQSEFLNFVTFFDFTPNAPMPTTEALALPDGHPYPIAELVRMRQLLDTIRPMERFEALAAANWPPAPGYYPRVLIHAYEQPGDLSEASFVDVVSNAYSRDYWAHQTAVWREADFFPGRLQYVEKAIDEFMENDFISSVSVIVPQFEGIVRDYLKAAGEEPRYRFESCLAQLKTLVLSRGIVLFPLKLIEFIFDFVQDGTFLQETGAVANPQGQINRHGIAHGVFTGFETKMMALKYLVLLDALALVLQQDKMVTGRL